MDRPVTIAIANDYEIVVVGIASALAPYGDRVEVVELDSSVPVERSVDLVLYDSFGQAQGHALDVPSIVRDSGGRLVVYTWNCDVDLVQESLAAGAAGYVQKTVTAEQLVDALERIHAGEAVVPEGCEGADVIIGDYPGDDAGLSQREAEVLALVCQGLSNDEVAARALIGANTVKTYIRSLYRKIGVTTRSQAVLWGVDHGFRPDKARQVKLSGGHGWRDVGSPTGQGG